MNNFITVLMEDLTPEEQHKYHALQEYMKVQFLGDIKKDHHGKVERLKEFELPVLKINDNKVEVITTVSKSPLASFAWKSTVDSDEFLASYISRL
jgi:hypothetical protein